MEFPLNLLCVRDGTVEIWVVWRILFQRILQYTSHYVSFYVLFLKKTHEKRMSFVLET